MRTHQTPEEIIHSASPEQKIMWNHLFLRFGERVSMSPLFYEGVSVGSEFLVYKAGILYVAYSIHCSGTGAAVATPIMVSLYDETNTVNNYLNHGVGLFDVTAAVNEFSAKYEPITNVIFSRVILQNLTAIRFIGYRISF